MGITAQELQTILTGNPEIVVVDDGAPRRHTLNAPQVAVKPLAPSEHDEQVALFAWAAANEKAHPELEMLYALPLGGKRHPAVGALLKQEGVKAGCLDISLDIARGNFHGLRIELKRADHSNHATPEQKVWIERLRHYGYCALVCYGASEAIRAIQSYLSQES